MLQASHPFRPNHRAPLPDLDLLLRSDPDGLLDWLQRWRIERLALCVVCVAIGAGLFGAAVGSWRDPLQAFYTGLKLPLVLLLTTLGNALVNGMLAPLLGLNVTFRQSLLLVLLTFTITALILGGFSPVVAFLVWNTSPLTVATKLVSTEYGLLQLTLATFVAYAGVLGNARLLPVLRRLSAQAGVARNVLFAWLATNLLLGSQISWLLRPFIWDPARPVEFLGPEYLRGSFFETVFEAVRRLILW
jgi:hypothetical protein